MRRRLTVNLALGALLMACQQAPQSPEIMTSAAAPPPSAVAGPHIRILGTAQDGGFPHAACDCRRCAAARQNPAPPRSVGRAIASLAVIVPPRVYLIDATPDVRRQLAALEDVTNDDRAGVNRSPLDGVFLTHAHMGHYLGLAFFGFEAVHTQGLPVHGTASMGRFLADNGPWGQLLRLGNIELVELTPGEPVSLVGTLGEEGSEILLEALPVPHRAEYTDTVGYRIRGPRSTVLYIPDCDPWHRWAAPFDDPRTLIESADVALLDGTFYSGDELPGRDLTKIGHPLIVDSMDLLEDSETQVWFTHFNHSNPVLNPEGETVQAIEARGFGVAHDGLELPL